MAELVWKNKAFQALSPQYASNTSNDPLKNETGLITSQFYPESAEHLTSHPWYNRLILGDNSSSLPLLLDEFSARVKLIYIDPPFMTGRTFSNGAHVAYKDTWRNSLDSYLEWLYNILRHLHRLLAEDGSMYIHLDWRVSHYIKIILDEIFGFNPLVNGPGFKNEIIWHYQSGGRAQKNFARKHDTLLFYTKSGNYSFHSERVGQKRGAHKRNHMRKEIGEDGSITWTIRSAGRTYTYHEDTVMSLSDVWTDISHLHQKDPERTGYATQKPRALLERILLASSDEDDLVMDCFCGSGVTPVVADQLGRRWIACDSSEQAVQTTRQRLLAQTPHHPFALQQLIQKQPM